MSCHLGSGLDGSMQSFCLLWYRGEILGPLFPDSWHRLSVLLPPGLWWALYPVVREKLHTAGAVVRDSLWQYLVLLSVLRIVLNVLHKGSLQLLEGHVYHSCRGAEWGHLRLQVVPWVRVYPRAVASPRASLAHRHLTRLSRTSQLGAAVVPRPKRKKLLIPTQLLLSSLLA